MNRSHDGAFASSCPRTNRSRDGYEYLFKSLKLHFLTWYLPLVVVVGTFGGIFCLLFLFKSKLFPKIILIWLVSICFADLLILQTDALRMMIKIWTDFDLRDTGTVICKLHNYFSNFFIYWSAYNQAALSLQRLYFIVRPLQARALLTSRRILIIWLILLILLLFPNLTYLIYWDIEKCSHDCEPVDKWFYYTTTLCDLLVSGIVPLATMTLATIFISVRVLRMKDDMRPKDGTGHCVHTGGGVGRRYGQDNAVHVTRLLVSMNLVYMLTTYPLLVYIMHLNFGLKNKVGKTIPHSVHKFCYYLLRSLSYLNACTNWIFYCAAGRLFRKRAMDVLLGLFNRRRLPLGTEYFQSMANNYMANKRDSWCKNHSASPTPYAARQAYSKQTPNQNINQSDSNETPFLNECNNYLISDTQC